MGIVSRDEGFWKKVAIVVMIITLIAVALAAWNYRKTVSVAREPAAELSGKSLILSAQSKKELIEFMSKEENIVAVSTISVSLTKNTREATFFETKSPGMKREWERYISQRDSYPKVFTNQEYYNSRITSIINGNFECRDTNKTIIAQLYNAAAYAPVICAISVPAGFDESGDFVGFINFYMKAEPLNGEKARLAKDATVLSQTIYKRDIARK